MAINLKRGLFRAWIVLSCLWLALSVFISKDDENFYSLRQPIVIGMAPPCKTVQAPKNTTPIEIPKWQTDPIVGGGKEPPCKAHQLDWAKASFQIEKGDIAEWNLSEKRWDISRNVLNWRGWIKATGFILGPPLALLLLGYVLNWVFAGFWVKE